MSETILSVLVFVVFFSFIFSGAACGGGLR